MLSLSSRAAPKPNAERLLCRSPPCPRLHYSSCKSQKATAARALLASQGCMHAPQAAGTRASVPWSGAFQNHDSRVLPNADTENQGEAFNHRHTTQRLLCATGSDPLSWHLRRVNIKGNLRFTLTRPFLPCHPA